MKKSLSLAALALIIAAGSAAGVGKSKDLLSLEAYGPEEKETELQGFCAQYWGDMSADESVCRFEQSFHFNFNHVGNSTLATHVPVIEKDSLSVYSASEVLPVVGKQEYNNAKFFISSSEGYLSFRAVPQTRFFTVGQVSLRRCFQDLEGEIKTVICPK